MRARNGGRRDERAGADVAIATSGVAGPGGGTPEHPVGTVCIALIADDVKVSRRYQVRSSTRDWVKLFTSQVALDWLRRYAPGTPDRRVGAFPPLRAAARSSRYAAAIQ